MPARPRLRPHRPDRPHRHQARHRPTPEHHHTGRTAPHHQGDRHQPRDVCRSLPDREFRLAAGQCGESHGLARGRVDEDERPRRLGLGGPDQPYGRLGGIDSIAFCDSPTATADDHTAAAIRTTNSDSESTAWPSACVRAGSGIPAASSPQSRTTSAETPRTHQRCRTALRASRSATGCPPVRHPAAARPASRLAAAGGRPHRRSAGRGCRRPRRAGSAPPHGATHLADRLNVVPSAKQKQRLSSGLAVTNVQQPQVHRGIKQRRVDQVLRAGVSTGSSISAY